ncbi:hypothetical protein OPT61_g5956 [Boeremia exigua]|uniref:Uncharacterized protein n=1 Tax=Boeremia exigua TaxID=749465 RepID=A0ACC2I8H5_9PLEO|nr:hypothetical protein OPT61_g5956 [Boeremia exigua]
MLCLTRPARDRAFGLLLGEHDRYGDLNAVISMQLYQRSSVLPSPLYDVRTRLSAPVSASALSSHSRRSSSLLMLHSEPAVLGAWTELDSHMQARIGLSALVYRSIGASVSEVAGLPDKLEDDSEPQGVRPEADAVGEYDCMMINSARHPQPSGPLKNSTFVENVPELRVDAAAVEARLHNKGSRLVILRGWLCEFGNRKPGASSCATVELAEVLRNAAIVEPAQL